MTTRIEWLAERSRARFVHRVIDWVRSTGGELCYYESWRGDELEDGDSCSFGDFHSIGKLPMAWLIERKLYYLPSYCSYSDYSGGSVEMSNHRLLVADYEEMLNEMYGDYGSKGLAINVDKLFDYRNERSAELREILERLTDYPCVDDEDVSRLEQELSDEDWQCWARSDFQRALGKKFQVDWEWDDSTTEDEVRCFFEDWREAANVYWENEQGPSMHVDIERVVNGIGGIDDVPKYGHCKTIRELVSVDTLASLIGTGIDWDEVKMELAGCEWEEMEDCCLRRLYLGSVFSLLPSGKYWTCWANSNVDEREAAIDVAWRELLESEAQDNGLWVESGEDDPTDLFVVECRQQIEN